MSTSEDEWRMGDVIVVNMWKFAVLEHRESLPTHC